MWSCWWTIHSGYILVGFIHVIYLNYLQDIVQSNPSSFPISSQELFSILDDASEETFLCGTAVSVQRFMFDGEAGKIVLEPRNLIACTSFLLEQKLVNVLPKIKIFCLPVNFSFCPLSLSLVAVLLVFGDKRCFSYTLCFTQIYLRCT